LQATVRLSQQATKNLTVVQAVADIRGPAPAGQESEQDYGTSGSYGQVGPTHFTIGHARVDDESCRTNPDFIPFSAFDPRSSAVELGLWQSFYSLMALTSSFGLFMGCPS